MRSLSRSRQLRWGPVGAGAAECLASCKKCFCRITVSLPQLAALQTLIQEHRSSLYLPIYIRRWRVCECFVESGRTSECGLLTLLARFDRDIFTSHFIDASDLAFWNCDWPRLPVYIAVSNCHTNSGRRSFGSIFSCDLHFTDL